MNFRILYLLSIGFVQADGLDEIVDGLGSAEYKVRELSTERLGEWVDDNGLVATNKLKELYQNTRTPEVRLRMSSVLYTSYRRYYGESYLGIVCDTDPSALKISLVRMGSPADKSGLMVGDEVMMVGKTHYVYGGYMGIVKLHSQLSITKPFEELVFKVRRGGVVMNVNVVVGIRDDETKLKVEYAKWLKQ